MNRRKGFIIYILCVCLLLISSTPLSSVKAANEQLMTPLTTFFNESVSASYTVSGEANTVIPLEIASQGNVTITVDYPALQNDYMLKVYTDDSFINMIHSSLLSTTNRQHSLSLTAGAAETLYLYITSTAKENLGTAYNFTITATLKKARTQTVSTNKTLKNKTWTKKRSIGAKSTHYYKLNIKNNQYFYLSSNNSYINVQLLDNKKKTALSSMVAMKSSNNFHASFSLGKGSYYIAVTAPTHTTYQLYYQFSKVKNIAGDKFKNSFKMSLGKQYVGILKATTPVTTGHFYKLKLKKDAKLQLSFYVENSSDKFQLQIYDAKKNSLPTGVYKIGNSNLLYINSRAKMPKGVYYIRIGKNVQETSGCYSIMARTK